MLRTRGRRGLVPPLTGAPDASRPRRGSRVLTTLLGWSTVLIGLVLVPLPGPGGLLIVGGLHLMAPHHPWAARLYEPTRRRAMSATRLGVSTWPRLAIAAVGPMSLVVLALAYTHGARIPEFTALGAHVGPTLPFDGLATTISLWSSAALAAALLVIGAIRWGPVPRSIATGADTQVLAVVQQASQR